MSACHVASPQSLEWGIGCADTFGGAWNRWSLEFLILGLIVRERGFAETPTVFDVAQSKVNGQAAQCWIDRAPPLTGYYAGYIQHFIHNLPITFKAVEAPIE
jgi:hypothetical protein